jgi:16S rRNA (adenine1518-N6/adenine1519-N6)-dimethyltransferase
VAAADVKPGDIVLEIGPGPGSLTQALLDAKAHVVAVEKDQILAQALERLKTDDNHLEIYCDDILTFPLEEKFKGQTDIKVIANLPYHLTTPILVYLLSKKHLFSSFTLMVQEEVGRRFAADPRNKDYGSFTVFLNFYTFPSYAFTVSRRCFYPEPKVDSAVVVLKTKEPPVVSSEESFFQMTRTAFGHRRKMLRASLKPIYGDLLVTIALEKLGLNPLARPEDLSLEDFLKLYEELNLRE